jgi:two-component system, cell cycle sensor histidine kinase and response regulator CckA
MSSRIREAVMMAYRMAPDASAIWRYGVAVATVLAGTGLRLAIHQALPEYSPYLVFILAVIISARFGGPGPGLAGTLLSTLSATWFFIEPVHSFGIAAAAAAWVLALFVTTAVLISLLVGGLRDSLLRTARAESHLRESEERFRTLADGVPQLVGMADAAGWFFWFNRRWNEYTGSTYEQTKRWGWLSAVDSEARPPILERWQHSMTTGEPFEMVLLMRGADGLARPFLARAVPLRDQEGKVTRWFATCTDISQQRKTEDALRRNHEAELARATELQAIMDAMPVPMFISRDPECRNMIGNRMAYELLRLPPGSNLSKVPPEGQEPAGFQMLKDGREIPTHEMPARKCTATGQAVRDYELDFVLPDGSRRNMVGNVLPLLDPGGRPRGAVAIYADVTEVKRSEERLRQMQKLETIGTLAAGVAHDFNNLLTVIMGSASSGLLRDPESEEHQSILAASERAAHLTKQLLAYAGKGQLLAETFDLSDLVSDSTQLLSAFVPKRVNLVFDLSREELHIKADPTQIEQILMNLVVNAGEAIPPQSEGRIRVATRSCDVTPEIAREYAPTFDVEPGRFVCLEVWDNGTGMDKATLARVFDPFFSTKFAGRGLGLAAAHGIVHSRKGFIEIRSSPGVGTTFRVFLPAAEKKQPAEDSIVSEASASQQRESGPATILVVDDEEMVCRMASSALQQQGYNVIEASDGRHALELLAGAASLPALALVDLAMPVMGGDELVPILRRNYPSLQIVVTSGYPWEEAERGFPPGTVADFLQKPYTVLKLAEKVGEILKSRAEETRR